MLHKNIISTHSTLHMCSQKFRQPAQCCFYRVLLSRGMADEHLIVVLHQTDSLNVSNLYKNDIILKQCIHLKKWYMEIASDTPNIN